MRNCGLPRSWAFPCIIRRMVSSIPFYLLISLLTRCLSGSDMRKLSTSVTRSLCDQIFTSPIQWSAATNFPKTATHAVDFGPGGLSGIGPLTARNLDGRGVRVVIVGDKGKGDSELYDSQNVRYEEWWSKKWGPQLVRTRYAKLLLVWFLLRL